MYTRTQLAGFLVPVLEEFNNAGALPYPTSASLRQVNLGGPPIGIAHLDPIDLPGPE